MKISLAIVDCLKRGYKSVIISAVTFLFSTVNPVLAQSGTSPGCTEATQTYGATAQNFTIAANTSNGTVVAPWFPVGAVKWKCWAGTNSWGTSTLSISMGISTVGGSNPFPAGGLKYELRGVMTGEDCTPSGLTCKKTGGSPGGYGWSTTFDFEVHVEAQIIKQGNLAAGTYNFSLPLVSVNANVHSSSAVKSKAIPGGSGTYTVTAAPAPPPPPVQKTCAASISHGTLNLGEIWAHEMTSVGSAGTPRDFQLLFNDCKGHNQVRYRLAPNPWTTTSNAIIPNTTGAGRATGVGVQILEGSSGTATVVFSNSGNGDSVPGYNPSCTGSCNYSIPLRARIIRTGNITQGTLSAQMHMVVQYN